MDPDSGDPDAVTEDPRAARYCRIPDPDGCLTLVADDGNYFTFLDGPLNIGLAIAVVVVLFLPQILDRIRGGKIKDEFADSGAEV